MRAAEIVKIASLVDTPILVERLPGMGTCNALDKAAGAAERDMLLIQLESIDDYDCVDLLRSLPEKDEPSLVVFDGLDRAPVRIGAIAWTLLLNRKVSDERNGLNYVATKNVRFIGLVSSSTSIDIALLNKCINVTLE
jgi:hypothetical protein